MVDWESFYNAFRAPDFIGGYEIQHRLGGGAFGEVYKARKLSIGKAYAIKFLKVDEGADRDAIQRELEQVRLFASIDHPNLVTIEDMGLVREVPFLIMGYAGEETLARRLKAGPLERDVALRTFVQVCRGVLALHDRRLAHFDLKPGNVFLKGDVARVGDYGLAKLLVEGRSSLSFGRGTPHYMAPEMLKSRADHRADIYSLGVILYECLAGRVPYGAAAGAVFLREDDAPPDFPPDFPPELRPTVETCLRIRPDDRFDSVHELLEDLGQTARQGDSVRMEWSTAPPIEAPRSAPGDDPDTPLSSDDLRRAAGHLARGAVGVARGVWDGVTGRGGDAAVPGPVPATAPDPPTPSDPTPGGDVVTVRTLAEPDESTTVPGAGRPAAAAPRGLVPPGAPGPIGPSGPAGGTLVAGSAGAFGGGLSVPVPPRESGGSLGALASTAVLGAEILGVLVTGPILTSLRAARDVFDRVLTGLPGALGAVTRLVLLVVFFMTLGAVTALVFLAALVGGNLYSG